LVRGSGAVAPFVVLCVSNDVNNVPALAARPQIDKGDIEAGKGIDGNAKPLSRFLTAQKAAYWHVSAYSFYIFRPGSHFPVR